MLHIPRKLCLVGNSLKLHPETVTFVFLNGNPEPKVNDAQPTPKMYFVRIILAYNFILTS